MCSQRTRIYDRNGELLYVGAIQSQRSCGSLDQMIVIASSFRSFHSVFYYIQYMPLSFGQMFPSTRVILDATECVMNKPSHVAVQSSTFSSYKNKNTVKTMIGCTPRGAVCFISESYSGSTSDHQIIERSPLCTEPGYFTSGDSIMADRGIMVQDLFASKNVPVNTPHMLKGKSQPEPEQVVHDRLVAAKRIHI